jgi:competence protein ComEC
MPSRLLYSIIFGFAGGVLLATLLVLPPYFLPALVVASIVLTTAGMLSSVSFKNVLLLAGIFTIAVVLGALRYESSLHDQKLPYEPMVGEKISLTGTIVREVERRESNQRFLIETHDEGEHILVSADLYPEYVYGDIVEVTGKLAKPDNFETDQGKEFDYIHYLAKDDIFYTMSFAQVSVLGHEAPSRVLEMLLSFKARLMKNIEDVVRRPESTFLGGIALGSRAGISSELREDFITTGTIHIVALSGYNISIVAKYIQDFFGLFLSFSFAIYAGALSIVLFVLMTGAQATAVRAGIMALLVLLAKRTGRTYEITRALMIAGFFMVLHNPSILVHDVSFQLSFLATLGIIYGTPIFEKWFGKKENEKMAVGVMQKAKRGMRDIVATTLAAQIAVLPFIMYTMGTLSIISFPINIVILPFIPIAMALGFIIALLGFLGSWLTLPLGYAVTLLLGLVLSLIEWGADVPHALVVVRDMPLFVMLAVYCALVYFVYRWIVRQRIRSGSNVG